jgi:hypothetical protein
MCVRDTGVYGRGGVGGQRWCVAGEGGVGGWGQRAACRCRCTASVAWCMVIVHAYCMLP